MESPSPCARLSFMTSSPEEGIKTPPDMVLGRHTCCGFILGCLGVSRDLCLVHVVSTWVFRAGAVWSCQK